MLRASLIFYVLLLMLAGVSSFAQATISSRHYTVDEGLAQQDVNTLCQDERGFIWIGTNGGLSRFDGHEFKNYGKNEGLNSKVIKKILPFTDSLLVLETVSSGALFYAFDGVEFRRIPIPSYRQPIRLSAAKAPYIFIHIFNDKNAHSSVDVYDYSNQKVQRITNKGAAITKIITHRDSLFFVDENNEYGFLDVALDAHSLGKSKYKINLQSIDKRLFLVETIRKHSSYIYRDAYSQKIILHYNRNGNVKIMGNPPSYLIDSDYSFLNYNYQTASYDSVSTIYRDVHFRDKDSRIWVGTNNGLYEYNQIFLFYDSPPFKDVYSIINDSTNNVYRLLHHKRSKDYWCDRKLNLVHNTKPLTARRYWYGATFKNTSIYVPTSKGLLIRKKNSQDVSIEMPKQSGMIGIPFRNNDFLVGGRQTLLWAKADGSYSLITIPDSLVDNTYILALLELHDGSILLGSPNGIVSWEPMRNEFRRIPFPNVVVSMEVDSDGQVWVGTTNGLFLLNNNKAKYKQVLAKHLNDEVITDLKLIADSLLLVGTTYRLLGIDPRTVGDVSPKYKIYNRSNGFMGVEVIQKGIQNFGKYIWVSGKAGLSIIDKNSLDLSKNEFDNLWVESVNGDTLSFSDNNHLEYSLSQNVGELVVEYSAIGANRPEPKIFSYRLLGRDEKWSDWTKNKVAFFNRLSSGDYTFCLRKKNTTGQDDDDEIRLKIHVSLALWKEPYFPMLASVIITVFGLLMGLFIYLSERNKIAKKHAHLQLEIERERADYQQLIAEKEIEQNAQLQKKNETIKILFSNIRHFARRALLITKMTISNDASEQSEPVQEFARITSTRIQSFISVFDMLKHAESDNLSVQQQLKKLAQYIGDAVTSESYKIHFDLDVDEDLSMPTERTSDLVAIVTELVINSYNHVKPVKNQLNIQILITKIDGVNYQLVYEDNGLGVFPPSAQSKSMGLFLIRGYAQKLGGSVVFDGSVTVIFRAL